MENKLKKPSLPADVAKEYDSIIVPTTVMISKGKAQGTYDLTKISLVDAKKLAEAGKYLVAKKATDKK
ncbi:hypothetical protein [Algoriphagus resistens]|uniref:hypothetical protein n=1 Tax=Algoriphagus resistens TaxID=1750590 RepID=UPI000716BC6C|nr:hypothetical protein [Algoriphagus resistens]